MTRTSKIILGILVVVLLTTIAFVMLTKKNVKDDTASVVTPSVPVDQTKTQTPSVETQTPTEDSATVAPVSQPAPVEQKNNKGQELQDQINAGTITPEEAMKQIDALNK